MILWQPDTWSFGLHVIWWCFIFLFHENLLNGFQVIVQTWNYHCKISKANNSQNVWIREMVLVVCTSSDNAPHSMISMTFLERFPRYGADTILWQMDRQTAKQGKNNMTPPYSRGDLNTNKLGASKIVLQSLFWIHLSTYKQAYWWISQKSNAYQCTGTQNPFQAHPGLLLGYTITGLTELGKALAAEQNMINYVQSSNVSRALTPIFGNGAGAFGIGEISDILTKTGKMKHYAPNHMLAHYGTWFQTVCNISGS